LERPAPSLPPRSQRTRTPGARRDCYSYDAVAWCYDELASAYSLGRIARACRAQQRHLQPGDRALYVGVGRGRDALEAASRGVHVTAVDVSAAMLRRLRRRAEALGVVIDVRREDLFAHEAERPYDAVLANFVLNLFGEATAARCVAQLAGLLGPRGRLLIADFAPPRGKLVERLLVNAYFRPLNLAAWPLGLCALHPLVDFEPAFEAAGLKLVERRGFRLPGVGPDLYESLVAMQR